MVGVNTRPRSDEVIWHDVECGSYAQDLGLWRELAGEHGPDGVLDLGAGTGRVALDLAAHDLEVTALELDQDLAHEIETRAAALGLAVSVHRGDARTFDLGRKFGAVLAPMQLAHLMGGQAGRLELLQTMSRHLVPGGVAALALLDQDDPFEEGSPAPLPDVREVDDWVFSSTPVAVRLVTDGLELVRHRQSVSPDGALTETDSRVLLDLFDPDELEGSAAGFGLRPAGRRSISETPDHVGSLVVLLEAGA